MTSSLQRMAPLGLPVSALAPPPAASVAGAFKPLSGGVAPLLTGLAREFAFADGARHLPSAAATGTVGASPRLSFAGEANNRRFALDPHGEAA